MALPQDFGDFRPVHDLAFSSTDVLGALDVFSMEMRAAGAALTGLSVASVSADACVVRAWISGIAPQEAQTLAEALAHHPGVSHASVEHILWRTQR